MANHTPMGNLSTKIAPGFTHKRAMRIERIARLELSGYTEDEIAFQQGISKIRVNQIKRTPEYIAKRMQIATGVVAQADRTMYEDISTVHSMVRDMVPESLQAIRDAILDKSNPSLRLKASQDLLDREGTLAKVSRTEVKKVVEYDFSQTDKVSTTLLEVLRNSENGRSEAIGIRQDSNLDSGQDPDSNFSFVGDQFQNSGIEEFSKAALDKEQQKQLQRSLAIIQGFETAEGKTIN